MRGSFRTWRRFAAPAAGLALGFAAVACGSSGQSTSPATSASQVTATLKEWKILLSSASLAPGTYTFVAHNAGTTVHTLEINGPGVVNERVPADLQPGQTGRLTVTLQPGTYDVFCPIDDHKSLGMDTHVTVSPGSGAGAGATASTGATTTPSTAAPATTAPTTTAQSGNGY